MSGLETLLLRGIDGGSFFGTDVDTSTEFIPSEAERLSAGVRANGASEEPHRINIAVPDLVTSSPVDNLATTI